MASLSNREVRAADGLERARGVGRLTTVVRDQATRIATFYQEGCAKIRLPHTFDSSLQAVLINTAGGLCGGDEISWEADAAPGARVVLTTQACERVYRSLGAEARIETRLSAGPGACLDWLPQETILFEGARLDRRLEVDLSHDARFLAVEAILLGREARGETARNATLADSWRIRRGGRLLHAEAMQLTADPMERDAISLLDGAAAFATVLYVGKDVELRAEAIRPLLDGRSGLSVIGERLAIRALAPSGLALRRLVAPILVRLSAAGALPRLWTM